MPDLNDFLHTAEGAGLFSSPTVFFCDFWANVYARKLKYGMLNLRVKTNPLASHSISAGSGRWPMTSQGSLCTVRIVTSRPGNAVNPNECVHGRCDFKKVKNRRGPTTLSAYVANRVWRGLKQYERLSVLQCSVIAIVNSYCWCIHNRYLFISVLCVCRTGL